MNKFNSGIDIIDSCCVTGETKLMTVDGIKTFKELADTNEDVNVYCLDVDGNLKVSKMFHPRVSGYNIEVMKVVLSNGTELSVTTNHRFLTKDGYEADLYNIKSGISTVSDNYNYLSVKSVEFPGTRVNVYNGTVAVYHNYFTIDEKTGTIVNQYN